GRILTPREMHSGFTSVARALALVDFKTAGDPSLPTRCYLRPEPVRGRPSRGGRQEWIFPPRFRKFSGKRLFVETRFESVEGGPYVALVWRGRGGGEGIRGLGGEGFLGAPRGGHAAPPVGAGVGPA